MPADRSYALTRATSYSTCLAAAAAGAAQRGVVHSVFYAAANIVFPGGLVLSLNAADSTRMPNGLELSNSPGTFPFTILRPGMPVLLGAQRLHIESAHCSLDLSSCTQWNPHITRPVCLDRHNIVKNREWLARYPCMAFSPCCYPRERLQNRYTPYGTLSMWTWNRLNTVR